MKEIVTADGYTNSYQAVFEPETGLWRVVQKRSKGDFVSHNGLAPRYKTEEEAEKALSKFTL